MILGRLDLLLAALRNKKIAVSRLLARGCGRPCLETGSSVDVGSTAGANCVRPLLILV